MAPEFVLTGLGTVPLAGIFVLVVTTVEMAGFALFEMFVVVVVLAA